jgi:hypothetical protein
MKPSSICLNAFAGSSLKPLISWLTAPAALATRPAAPLTVPTTPLLCPEVDDDSASAADDGWSEDAAVAEEGEDVG